EFSLFYEFFSTGEDDLYGNLDLLCSYMYDNLRPRIIHETKIETLSELCLILISHINLDVDKNDGSKHEKEGTRLHFSQLIRNVLQDAQQRLVFRAQTFIQSSIQKFIPQQSDLDYPNKLKKSVRTQSTETPAFTDVKESLPSQTPAAKQDGDTESIISNSSSLTITEDVGDGNPEWLPTLHRTLWILSKIYQCVNPSIFNDIAQDVVHLCLQTLLSASEVITRESKIDGQLFLIKHLLILKDQIASFDTQFVHDEKDLDFSLMT
ncbi:12213_t:CDS:2, partial [Acaulospora morrowiae]